MEARKCGHGVGRVYSGECMFDFQSRASFVIRFRLPTARVVSPRQQPDPDPFENGHKPKYSWCRALDRFETSLHEETAEYARRTLFRDGQPHAQRLHLIQIGVCANVENQTMKACLNLLFDA